MQAISCPVCWGQLESAKLGCTRCQTPHHEECFAFTGGCAVFGCGSKTIGAVQFSAPALEMTSQDMSGDNLAAHLGQDAPRVRAGLPRGSLQRLSDAFRCLARNWRLVLALSVFTALIDASGALLLDVTPISGLQRVSPAAAGDDTMTRVSKELAAANGASPAATSRGRARAGARAPLMPTGDVSGPRIALGMTLLVIGRNLMPFLYGVLVMVFLFSAARGKDLSAGEHISVALSRIGRCIWASIQTWFVTVIPFALAVGVSFATGNGFLIFLVFSTGLAWMFYMFNEFWLVIPVAAMGPEEEPGNVLARSRQLVGVDRWRVWRGTMFTALVLGFSVMLSMLFVSFVTLMLPGYWMRMAWETFGIVLTTAVTLLMPIYQALLYFECRRALEKDFLKYAPEGMTGTDRA